MLKYGIVYFGWSLCDFGRLVEGKGIDKQRAVTRIAAWHVVCFAGLIWTPIAHCPLSATPSSSTPS